jgi:hypothetical protein
MPITIPQGVPLIGGQTIGPPDQPAAPATVPDTSAFNAALARLKAKYGEPVGAPSPRVLTNASGAPVVKDNKLQPTGFDLYTFADGTTVELKPNGETQNLKEAKPTTQSATDQLAQQGVYVSGNQIWQKGADGVWAQSDASKATQALTDAKTQADTTYQQALTQKAQIDSALAADPTNQALQQQKTAADTALAQAQTASQQATAQATLISSQIAQAKAGPDIANTQATTAGTQATTARTTALTPIEVQTAKTAADKAAQDLAANPTNIQLQQAKTAADTAYQQALTQSTLAKSGEPTVWQTGTTAPTTTYYDPTTGKVVDRANSSYVPTDPGRMQVQLQQQAAAQQQALQQQVVSGQLTADQAATQFDQWWQTNAEPIKGSIAQAQAAAQSAIALQQAQTNQANTAAAIAPATLAQTASNQAQSNLISMLPYVVGKGTATTPGITQGANGFPKMDIGQIMQNATYSLPNLQEVGRQGAAAALANISPTAQMHMQMPGAPAAPPMPGLANGLPDMLNRGAYAFGAPPPPAAAAGATAAPPTAPAVPPGMYTPWYQQQYPGAGGAGMPATGPVAGAAGGGWPWQWPPYQPAG